MPAIEINVLGGLKVVQDGRTISRFRSRQTGMVLAYLAMHPGHRVSREQLAETMWPESEPAAARHNLRMALSSLRGQLNDPSTGGPSLASDATALRLEPQAYVCDALTFQEKLQASEEADSESEEAADLAEALRLYRGAVLNGYYNDWVQETQRRVEEQMVNAAVRLST